MGGKILMERTEQNVQKELFLVCHSWQVVNDLVKKLKNARRLFGVHSVARFDQGPVQKLINDAHARSLELLI